MLEDSQLSGGFSALNSGSMGAIAGLDPSNQSSGSGLGLLNPIQQQLSLSSSSTIFAAQTVPPTDLILNFNGGLVQREQGYDLPKNTDFNGYTFGAFTAFDRNNGTPGNLDEQILQIVAGVREDFARFNVRVIWDDRGVNSPFYDNQDTVVMLVADSPLNLTKTDNPEALTAGTYGVASNVDIQRAADGSVDQVQRRRDVAFSFVPSITNDPSFTFTFQRLAQLIKTTSHEAGHTFGLSHVIPDTINNPAPRREIMGTGANGTQIDPDFDSFFFATQIGRDAPEDQPKDRPYSDEDRLNQALGSISTPPTDVFSNQTLLRDMTRVPLLGFIPVEGFLPQNGTIDFSGDRDAFRFQVSASGQYTIRETSSAFTPVVSLWDSNGDFVSVSNGGKITFDAVISRDYFAVVGNTADQEPTFTETDPATGVVSTLRGNLPNGQIGNYVLEIGNSKPVAATDQFSVVENSLITGNILNNDSDSDGNPLTSNLVRNVAHGNLALNPGGSFTYTPNADFFGTDSFSYRASDSLTSSELTIVSFTIAEAPLIDLIGTSGRDVLRGTDGRDRIIGLQSGDILTGGKGRDQFVFQNINEGGDRITDFTIGKDKVVLSGVLQSINYGGSDPIADGIISFRQANPNLAVLQIDPDGSSKSAFRPVPFILFDNLFVDALSDPNNFIL